MASSNPPSAAGIGPDPPAATAVLAHFRDRIAAAPDDPTLWARFAWTLGASRGIEEVPVATADEVLTRALAHPAVDPAALPSALRAHLRRLPVLGPWLREADRLADPPPLPGAVAEAAASNRPVRRVLAELLFPDPAFDRLVGALRRHLLLEPTPSLAADVSLAVEVALACHRGDYPHPMGADERGEVERWAERGAEAWMEAPGAEARLAILAAYRPLGEWPWAGDLEARVVAGGSPALRPLVDRQLQEPRREAELGRTLPRLRRAAASDHPVRTFYEAHPYPRWARLGFREPLRLPARIEVELMGRRPSGLPDPARPEVLVAGCGTGLHPLAVRAGLRDAAVTAIDVSLSSLAYASRKAEELGLTDVDFLQADLLECPAWGRQFDVVESVGVLHHLEDPAAGFEALAGRLRAGGLLKVGVYSRRGRAPMDRARALLAERGLIPSHGIAGPDRVRAARETLLPLLRNDPGLRPLLEVRDLYALSSFRDLLLHPLETAFDLQGIGTLLRSNGLRFLGFAELPRSTLAAFRARFPEPEAETDLGAWDAFEAERPSTFLGMYRFWCQRPG